MDDTRKQRIEQTVAQKTDEMASVDDLYFGDVIGTAQACGQLKEALDKLDQLTHIREYEKAAQLGYEAIASEFIFLQRCLGGLNSANMSKDILIQDIVMELTPELENLSYEEVAPFVKTKMKSFQPRPTVEGEKIPVHLKIDADVLSLFRSQGGDYKARISQVLREYCDANHNHE